MPAINLFLNKTVDEKFNPPEVDLADQLFIDQALNLMSDLGTALAGICMSFDISLLKNLKNYLLVFNRQSNKHNESITLFEQVFHI